MAYFALLDPTNTVTQVFIVADDNCSGDTFIEREQAGQQFCQTEFGPGRYLMTSREHEFRKRYAGIGYTYDEEQDAFLVPKPYPSWVFDENYDWQPPVPMPDDGGQYAWNEEQQTWDLIPEPTEE